MGSPFGGQEHHENVSGSSCRSASQLPDTASAMHFSIPPASPPGQNEPNDSAPDVQAGAHASAPSGGRLNLLLSYGGWENESWVDRIPALLTPLGVTTHRARSARHATDVIQSTTIHIAVVDLGLPFDVSPSPNIADEAGTRVLELLRRLPNQPPSLVIKRARTQREDAREMAAALRCGAFTVLDRPRASRDLEMLLEALRRCLVRHYGGQWPGL